MRLTETAIERLPILKNIELISDDLTRGLYLKRYPSGKMTWQYRSRKGGAWRVVTIGTHPVMNLAAARQKATDLDKVGAPVAMTFGQLLDAWYEKRIEGRYKVTKNIEVYVNRGKEWLGHVQLSALTTQQLVAKLQAYADVAAVGANRCLSNWKLALDYATEIGALTTNPLARTTSRAVGGEEKSRDRTLSDKEIEALWADTHDHGPLLRALLLTGCRISELQAATVDQLDGDVLRIPDNKSSRPHWVPVTPALRQQFGNHGSHLFEVRSNTAVQARLKRIGVGWTPHDLRRTFATRMAGAGVAPHVVEKMLNHSMQGVMAIYNRHGYEKERIEAAKLWTVKKGKLILPPVVSETH
jgi:integrase